MLGRRLTPENHVELLAAAAGKSKAQVEVVLAGFFPKPDVRSSVRAVGVVPGPSAVAPEAASVDALPLSSASAPSAPWVSTSIDAALPFGSVPAVKSNATRPSGTPAAVAAEPPPRRSVVRPLAPESIRVPIHG